MKTYKIFKHPQGKVEAVKQGWSWPAFFLLWIWALVKRMWVLGIVTGLFFFVVGSVLDAIASPPPGAPSHVVAAAYLIVALVYGVMALIWGVWFGSKGNRWREKKLSSRGYDEVATLQASSPEAAIAMYLRPNAAGPETPTSRQTVNRTPNAKSQPTREPEFEMVDEDSTSKVHIRCTNCGLEKDVDRNKFGNRTGTIKVKCPNCKQVLPVFLGN